MPWYGFVKSSFTTQETGSARCRWVVVHKLLEVNYVAMLCILFYFITEPSDTEEVSVFRCIMLMILVSGLKSLILVAQFRRIFVV